MARTHKKIGLVSLQFIENKLKLTFPKHLTKKDVNDWKIQNKDAIREFTERLTVKVIKQVKKVVPEKTDKEIAESLFKKCDDQMLEIHALSETLVKCEAEKKSLQESFEILQKSNQQLQKTSELQSQQWESQEKQVTKLNAEIVTLKNVVTSKSEK